MGCCGKKRKALNYIYSTPSLSGISAQSKMASHKRTGLFQADAVFKYTGSRSLDIRGFSHKQSYHFSANAPEQKVNSEDVGLMRGYAELMEVKR